MLSLALALMLALTICLGFLPETVFAAQSGSVTFLLKTAVFSISKETFVRWTDEQASLDECGEDEYVTVCAVITNTSGAAVPFRSPCIIIDGGEKLYWTDFTLEAGETVICHVFHSNVQYLISGLHTAVIFASDEPLYSSRFSIGRAWSEIFTFPTETQIAARTVNERSPYIYTWLSVGSGVRYDAYSVDFKSDYIPYGTYSSLFNGYLDFSSLKEQYKSVNNNGHISLYGGLQQGAEWEASNSILSFWDIYCTDTVGNTVVIRPKRIFPAEETDNDSFGNEGEGAHTQIPYDWQAGHWYRMLLQCGISETTGNTTVEQWFQNLTTEEWTHICTYDTGVKNSGFIGDMALFSENFLPQYAGGVRSLEFTNVRIHTSEGWCNVNSSKYTNIQTSDVHENAYGSWEAGADQNSFYMISTGVSGWGRTEKTGAFSIQNHESGSPLQKITTND